MWEITLIGKPCDIAYFLELKDYLKNNLEKECIVVITFENNLICSIAIADNKHKKFLINSIYETIVKIVKAEYYESKLNIFSDDKSLNSFIMSSLVLINLLEEINYSKNTTRLTNVLNIRSFIYFKLHRLIQVWDKEIEYYNSTFTGEYKDGLYLEFLRFIAQNSHNKLDIAYLEDNAKEMLLLDKRKNTIRVLSKSDEIGIIVCLVMYAPKKLIINCLNSLSKKVANLISYIFEDRVSILL